MRRAPRTTWRASACFMGWRRRCFSSLASGGSGSSRGSVGRQDDARFFLMAAVEHADIADALDERAAGALGERGEDGVAFVAVADAGAHFHELVGAERGFELAGHAR